LSLELENAQTSLVPTRDKLDSKSKALDLQVFYADEAMLRLKNAESRLKAAEEDLKNQMQLLESAQKTSSKRESSFNMMISSVVAHATTLFKNHLPGLILELLRQDFTVDDAECETLVSSAFDVAQDFVSSYDLPVLILELLREDFTVDDVERETLVSNVFDVAQDFVSSYDFASLAESDDNGSPKAL
jgi:hypothetical protein